MRYKSLTIVHSCDGLPAEAQTYIVEDRVLPTSVMNGDLDGIVCHCLDERFVSRIVDCLNASDVVLSPRREATGIAAIN